MTSPYDYIITVVAPGCSQKDPPLDEMARLRSGYGRCGDDPDHGFGGTMVEQVQQRSCYGVPLYRQLLTGNDGKDGKPRTREWTRWFDAKCDVNRNTPQCRWPFIRMAGQNIYQRHTLTLNGGTYYLDTSVPLDTQQTEPFTKKPGAARDVNVFEGGQTYYVFFLYTKPSTNQTYQIYVGDGFQQSSVKPVRGSLAVAPSSSPTGPIRLSG